MPARVPGAEYWARIGSYCWLALILLGTLGLPGDPNTIPRGLCLICGTRGAADAIVNLLMFVPLGLAVAGGVWRKAAALVFILPVGIELIQRVLPGRHSSLGDVLFNVGGVTLGFLTLRILKWSRAQNPALGALLWGGVVGLTMLGFSLTQLPLLPESQYFANWNPDLRTVKPYPGVVRSVTMDGVSIPSGPIAGSTPVRTKLLIGSEVEVTFRRAPLAADGDLYGIFGIWDEGRSEVLFVGVRDGLVVIRSWSWGRQLRLNHWSPGVAHPSLVDAPGDDATFRISWTSESGACISFEGRLSCQPMLTPGDSWTMIQSPPATAFGPWVTMLWMAALFFPFGGLAGGARFGALAGVSTAMLILTLPVFLPVGYMGSSGWFGAIAGVIAGRLTESKSRQVFHRCNGCSERQP